MQIEQKYEFVLGADGSVIQRAITETEIDVGQELLNRLTRGHCVRLPNLVRWRDLGMIGLAAASDCTYWTLHLEKLTLRCPWRLVADDVMVPMFNSADPVSTIEWMPPSGCHLALLMRSLAEPVRNGKSPTRFEVAWFFALTDQGAAYRLPIANVHDDCSVCTGAGDIRRDTAWEALEAFINQFQNSPYNADLWRSAELTHAMFRVKPLKAGDGFKTLAPTKDWTSLSSKVGSTMVSYIA